MARHSSLPDLHKFSLSRLDEREEIREKSLAFKEISERNEGGQKLPLFYRQVSSWERGTVEEVFHIYYANSFCESPSDILNRLTVDELTDEQNNYFTTIQRYLHFDTDVNELHLFGDRVVLKLKTKLEELDSEQKEFIKRAVHKFLISIIRLAEQLKNYGNIANICDGVYTKLFCSFVDMCCLESVLTCKTVRSIWKNLRGINKVVSEPDIRLYKYGVTTESSRDTKTVVSVVKVNKNRHHRELESSDSEDDSYRSMDSISSLSSENSDSANEKPRIAWILNKEVLGQHAGELLLEMHKFCQTSGDRTVYTMPGVIVKGTEIYFTVLEMSSRHYKKLETNEELDEGDRAVIYYSKPHDFLKEEYRNVLIANFLKMNNIK